MTETDRLRDDLAYVRAAVERQREALCRAVPMWFAGIIAAYLIGLAVLRDLFSHDLVAEAPVHLWKIIGFAGLVTILLSRAFRRGGHAGAAAAEPALSRAQKVRQAVPFFIFLAGAAFIKLYANGAGIESAAMTPVILVYVAVSFMLLGYNGLRLLFWMGAGLGVAAVAYTLLDVEFKRTLLGLGFGTGVLLGAWLDRRMLKRRAG